MHTSFKPKSLVFTPFILAALALTTPAQAQLTNVATDYAGLGEFGGKSEGEVLLRRDATAGSKNNRLMWIKFDLAGDTYNPNQAATFSMTFRSTTNEIGNYTVEAYGLDEPFVPPVNELGTDWTEELITNANAPGRAGNGHNFDLNDFTLLGGVTFQPFDEPGKTITFTILNLGDYIQADETVTIGVRSTTQSNTYFNFEDRNSADPSLAPTLAQIPEPSTAAIVAGLLVGGLALMRRRR